MVALQAVGHSRPESGKESIREGPRSRDPAILTYTYTTENDEERLSTSSERQFRRQYLQLTVIVDEFSNFFQNFY